MKRRDFVRKGAGGAVAAGLIPGAVRAENKVPESGDRRTDQWLKVATGKRGTLVESGETLPEKLVHSLVSWVSSLHSAQELDLVLRLLENRPGASPRDVAALLNLMQVDNLYLARRAYWFSRTRHLSESGQAKLDRMCFLA